MPGNRKKVMRYRIIVSKRASIEIIQSIDWYNEQKKGLGKRFFSKLNSVIRIIRKNPHAFEIRYKIYRCAPVDVFPFIVVYFIPEPGRIVISAVFHSSRNPNETFNKD
jgi:toxin ParE1/3/4